MEQAGKPTLKPGNPIATAGLESPTVGTGFDPGIPDRVPKPGVDVSTPDSRLALRNEAKARVLFKNRDSIITEDKSIIF